MVLLIDRVSSCLSLGAFEWPGAPSVALPIFALPSGSAVAPESLMSQKQCTKIFIFLKVSENTGH